MHYSIGEGIVYRVPHISSCLSQLERMGKGLLLEKKIDTEESLKYQAITAPDANLSALDPHLCNAGNTPDSPSRRVSTSLFVEHSQQAE